MIGQELIDFIIESGLVMIDDRCLKEGYTSGVLIWSANSDEQITQFIKEHYDGNTESSL